LGSEGALETGIRKGDIFMKVVNGKAFYYMPTQYENEQTHEDRSPRESQTAIICFAGF